MKREEDLITDWHDEPIPVKLLLTQGPPEEQETDRSSCITWTLNICVMFYFQAWLIRFRLAAETQAACEGTTGWGGKENTSSPQLPALMQMTCALMKSQKLLRTFCAVLHILSKSKALHHLPWMFSTFAAFLKLNHCQYNLAFFYRNLQKKLQKVNIYL